MCTGSHSSTTGSSTLKVKGLKFHIWRCSQTDNVVSNDNCIIAGKHNERYGKVWFPSVVLQNRITQHLKWVGPG